MNSKVPIITLNNGIEMPQLGLGVWQVKNGQEIETAIHSALDSGYRMIDTASMYGNEEGVGEAVRSSNVSRDELFITTKLWNSDHGYKNTHKAFDESLKRLNMDYVDLYLIHWPVPKLHKTIETWRALEEIYNSGRAKAIGVCNFNISHLEEMMANTTIVPAVNQIELHPYLQQNELRNYCHEKGIHPESWAPIGGTGGDLLQNPTLADLAKKHGKSPAQIVLRWHIQIGQIIIPKSTHPERIAQNIDIFDFTLDENDMAAIAGLNADIRLGPDPNTMNAGISTGILRFASRLGLLHLRRH